jgi:sugar phosphate isomerase/epimerase
MRAPSSDTATLGGLKVGCQAWCFNNKTALEAVTLTAKAGGRFIEFFPGQKVSGDSEERMGPGVSDATVQVILSHCQKHRVTPLAFGVTNFSRNEAENYKTFVFAKKLGLYAITCEPAADAFDSLEALVKQFDIRIAIHNHPKQPGNPSYRYWDPGYVLELVGKRDSRLGACADIGHWVRSGIDPVRAIKQLKGRVFGCHLKELDRTAPDAGDAPCGQGNALAMGVLEELRRQRVAGAVSVEYETDFGNNAPEIGQCIGFVRGWAQARRYP